VKGVRKRKKSGTEEGFPLSVVRMHGHPTRFRDRNGGVKEPRVSNVTEGSPASKFRVVGERV